MRLPNADRAIIEAPKNPRLFVIVGASDRALQGASLSGHGLLCRQLVRLAEDLRSTHASADISATIPTDYGIKYEVRASLTGPNGVSVDVTSVWIVLKGEELPRFVTAYPGG